MQIMTKQEDRSQESGDRMTRAKTSGALFSSEFAVRPGALLEPLRLLEFRGRLTFGAESEERYEEVRALIRAGARHFIFDLSRVPDIDSAGIGFLVACLTTILRVSGNLALVAPSNRVLYSLLITRLDTVFPLFESVGDALRYFTPRRKDGRPQRV